MATKKNQEESKFYLAKTLKAAREKIEDKVKNFNEKFVKKQLKNSREFITELKADPVKKIDALIDDSKNTVNKVKETRVKTFKKAVEDRRSKARKGFKKINAKGNKVYKGIENDAKLLFEDFIEMGKKNIDKLPMKKTIEKKISDGFNSIPSKLNLPSKTEIDSLVKEIDGVNRKVDQLNKEYSAA